MLIVCEQIAMYNCVVSWSQDGGVGECGIGISCLAFMIDAGPTVQQNKWASVLISSSLYLMKYACPFWLPYMKYWCVVARMDKKQSSQATVPDNPQRVGQLR